MSFNILSVLVENKPGVMQKVSGMFRRRNFNIESITVGHCEQEGLSRMVLTVVGDDKIVEQVRKQLSKIVEVIKVVNIPKSESVIRELALIKVATDTERKRAEVVQFVEIFRGKILDVSPKAVTVEITGTSEKIDSFIALVKPLGIKEIARTGITAMRRSPKIE